MIESTKTATAVLILRSKLLTSNDGTEMTDVVQTLKISSYQTNFQITCLYDWVKSKTGSNSVFLQGKIRVSSAARDEGN